MTTNRFQPISVLVIIAEILIAAAYWGIPALGIAPSGPELQIRPALTESFRKSGIHEKLIEDNVSEVVFNCDIKSHRIIATFIFLKMHYQPSRSQIEVTGKTSCTQLGTFLQWRQYNEVRAQENYAVDIVLSEFAALMATPRYRGDIEDEIKHSF